MIRVKHGAVSQTIWSGLGQVQQALNIFQAGIQPLCANRGHDMGSFRCQCQPLAAEPFGGLANDWP